MSKVAHLFGVPIYLARLEDNFSDVQAELKNCVEKLENNWNVFHSTSTTPLNKDIVSEYGLRKFEYAMDIHIARYCEMIQFPYTPYKRRVSWMTKNVKGNYTHAHAHTPTDISGTYYYKTNGKDGNIFFMNPNLAGACSIVYSRLASYTELEPEEGLMLLFPSYLIHGVKTNETEDDRISLAFSVMYER